MLTSQIRVIDLAYQYAYETPEAFAKAFARFHGVPPSVVRRVYPRLRIYEPLRITVAREGGWTNASSLEPETYLARSYNESGSEKGGERMNTQHIAMEHMEHKEDWRTLLALARQLSEAGIDCKVDGKTMIFAHGLSFPLDKICLTFHWDDEQKMLDFFGYTESKTKSTIPGFKYFDTIFAGKMIRCMFYDSTGEAFVANTDLVEVDGQVLRVQSLEFYLNNATPDEVLYPMVEKWMQERKG